MIVVSDFASTLAEVPVGGASYATEDIEPSGTVPVEFSGQPQTLLAMPVTLNDEQLLSLLLASPLYKKLLQIKQLVLDGARGGKTGSCPEGVGFMDALDAQWANDDKHEPVPVNQVCLNPQAAVNLYVSIRSSSYVGRF